MRSHTKKQNKRTRFTRNAPNFDKEAVYKENIYDSQTFKKIRDFGNSIKDSNMVVDPKASGRAMFVLEPNHPIISVICNPDLINNVRKMTGNDRLKPCLSIPIEYRKYVVGSYMNWHRDTKMLPDQLQYECVITIKNTSDSLTLFKNNTGEKQMKTKPNSLLIVRAKGVNHAVTPLTKGERTIIKLVFSE